MYRSIARKYGTNKSASLGFLLLCIIVIPSLLADFITRLDPIAIDLANRFSPPSRDALFGTDMFGRDVFTRVVYGGRTSLLVGSIVAALATIIGVFIGTVAGYFRALDAIVMRAMDALMAIPGLLLAIALVAASGANLVTVVIAITLAEIPRVVRLVRSIVLSVREEPYVEAAVAMGIRPPAVMTRHVIPNTFGPLIVLTTYIFAHAVIVEAALGFLGVGMPPEVPSWGNMVAEGRVYIQLAPWTIFFPGLALTLTVLGINIFGDGLQDALDPRLAKSV